MFRFRSKLLRLARTPGSLAIRGELGRLIRPRLMKHPMPILAGLAVLLSPGCGTPNVNPAAPRSNTGYVDFYTDSDYSLAWEVKMAEEGSSKMKTVFCEYKPLESPVLRLAVL